VAGVVVGARLHDPAPVAQVKAVETSSVSVPNSTETLPWPTMGQGAIAVPSIGIDVASAPEMPVPVASLTKLMTAYVILHDHPLEPGQSGPHITITQANVDDYDEDTVQDESNAEVTLGEDLTEFQMLDGMLVHSANNLALALARWDAGGIAAFVAKMNQTAQKLGMDQTHYADPSGFDQTSQSTASDLLKVAGPDMTNPVFAAIVKQTSVTLPVAGTISTYTPLLGVQGVIGVKSGFTTQAGGCDVLAVVRKAHGLPVLIVAAVTGQTGANAVNVAGLHALDLANTVGTDIGATAVVKAGQVVAHVSVAGHTAAATVNSTIKVLSWPGVRASRLFTATRTITPGTRQGTRIGSIVVSLGTQRFTVPVRLNASLPKESLLRRIF
jgi:D-alanyl-D-alanine carboxypeptidase (penicillin-binding protein 5/6)